MQIDPIGWLKPWVLLGALAILMLLPVQLRGHAFQPAVLTLREDAQGRVEVRLLPGTPGSNIDAEGDLGLSPGLPARCRQVGQGGPRRWVLDCGPQGLSGATITVDASAAPGQEQGPGQDEVLVHVVRPDGSVRSGVVRPGARGLHVSGLEAALPVRGYFSLGVEHLLSGLDHLLFVLALLLLCSRAASPDERGALRRLLWTVSAFTVAHSLTLTLAVLGALRVPAVPAEACIALSLVFTAAAICKGEGGAPAGLAFGFGLLHGLGFAGVLAETGLPRGQIGPALLLFNLGIEAGQLLFVGLLIGAARLLRRRPFEALALARVKRPLSYAVGAAGSFFFWQRLALFLP